ncbi:signal peptidase I [Roseiterribacter gracilis]|uniref:Signal peptidase I n=1 Tax=Roseiterribacter gracilis TaxID=2812848 RepID=A0A8S8XDN8_9PROT|nr:signal peptidase I [Rhodospirillales bacterium TMPK1]
MRRFFAEAGRWALAILAVLVVRATVAAPFEIPSGSMLPTLQIGDRILASKFAYGWSRFSPPVTLPGPNGRLSFSDPKRGDVVVFVHPRQGNVWVKRVIGLPGDEVALLHGRLRINNVEVQRERVGVSQLETHGVRMPVTEYRETLPGAASSHAIWLVKDDAPLENWGPVRVPPGKLLMLGDNRDDSADSRVSLDDGGVGLLPIENVLGRADVILFSTAASPRFLHKVE